jgi:hypothetical protein
MDHPDIGDMAHIRANLNRLHANAYGIVSKVRTRRDGQWTAVELLIAGQRLWFDRAEIDAVLKTRNSFKIEPGGKHTPCRLFAILAREAATAVIFRRGPSRWVQLVHWNTATDIFESGQWFHGRLYEQRADLSPDGTKLIYFAAKITGRTLSNKAYSYAWTAISKPPYLTALALWPKRLSGTYFGGGLFTTATHIWLNHLPGEAEAHPHHQPPRELEVTPSTFDPRYQTGFYRRLHRDGWQVDPAWWQQYESSGFVTAPPAWHEKPHPQHAYRLVMESNIFYSSEPPAFALQDDRRGELTPLEGAIWADWDQRGRLVYAKDGKLFALEITGQHPGNPIELADFNNARPEPREAPAWATVW